MKKNLHFTILICLIASSTLLRSQNLVVDGNIASTNVNWGGGSSEAPFTSTTFEDTYITGGCTSNYVMEVDNASNPTQVVNGFTSGSQYILSFRYSWRTSGCNASVNPTNLVIQFTDATSVLSYTLSVGSGVTSLTPVSTTFTNNSSTSHTLKLTNPGNTNTCGVIVDDISITRVASPGGVGSSNLTMWFNANSIGSADGSNVYGWLSSGNGGTVEVALPGCAAPPVYKTGVASTASALIANYNPYVTFNGSTEYLQYTSTRLNLFDLSSGGNGGSYFSSYMAGTAGNFVFGHQGSGNSRILAKNNEIVFGNTAASGTNNDVAITNSSRVNITSFNGKSTGLTVKDLNGTDQPVHSGSADVDYLTIGVRRNGAGTYSGYFDGYISELIAFNTILSNTQMQQVRSYLAAKYGVTLTDNTTTAGLDERNYLASDGTTTYWNYTASNSGYHNNVTVIGRDDNTSLDQRKSISTDADANGWGTTSMLTINNGGAFTADKSYLAVGHNGQPLYNILETVDIPTGIQSRMERFWKFQKTGTGVASSVSVSFDMNGFSPITGTDLRLLVSTAQTFGTATTTIVTGSYSGTVFTASLPTTGGVYFTVGSVNNTTSPLPIELLSFTAASRNDEVCLNWSTASEKNNDYFTIEKTKDAVNYDFVAKVTGAGNSTTRRDYSTEDNAPYEGVSYYRLKQTDYNGNFTYSNLAQVDFKSAFNNFSFNVYPNPSTGDNVSLAFNADKGKELLVVVYDVSGREAYSKVMITEEKGKNVFALDPSGKLAPGIYMITATSDDNFQSKKLIVK